MRAVTPPSFELSQARQRTPENKVVVFFNCVFTQQKRLLTSQVLLQIKTVNLDEVPSATTTTSLYVPSAPSTPDCNISEEYIIVENRSYSMDYLTGPGVPEWHLNEDSIRVSIFNAWRDMNEILIIFLFVIPLFPVGCKQHRHH